GSARPAATAGRGGAPRGTDGGNGSVGRVFVMRNGQISLVRVQTGVTDGAMTAIVGGDLREGDQVITAMSEPGTGGQQTSSPFLFGRRGGAANGNRAGSAAPSGRGAGAGR